MCLGVPECFPIGNTSEIKGRFLWLLYALFLLRPNIHTVNDIVLLLLNVILMSFLFHTQAHLITTIQDTKLPVPIKFNLGLLVHIAASYISSVSAVRIFIIK